MSPLRLSFCIPVYNFGSFLGPTLDSLIRQATDEVEIVVLDGGSTDDTPAVVARAQASFPRLNYVRRPQKGGIDRDMAHAVAAARGEYVWIFSGDDLLREGSVARVLAELDRGVDALLVESMLCDFEMRPLAVHRMARIDAPRTFRLHDPAERREYFELALNTAAFFSFCSALVIRRDRWETTPVDESFYGCCFAHAARLFTMLPQGLTIRYLPGPALDKRGGNDSFNTRGFAHRYGIAINGYHRIGDVFFGHDSLEARHLRRSVRLEQPWTGWLAAKAEIAETGRHDQHELYRRLLWKQYADPSPGNWTTWALCRLAPAWMLKYLKRGWETRQRAKGRAS
jgi:abequosyltransferase